jgi:hypothetical protein
MDPYLRFLDSTWAAAQTLQAQSNVMGLRPSGRYPYSVYQLSFAIPYLSLSASGIVEVAPGPVNASIHFPADYLHSGDRMLSTRVVTVETAGFVHPNVRGAVCLGSAFQPGTPVRTLISALYSVLTYQVFTTDERNALNPLACRLVREHRHLIEGFGWAPLLRHAAKHTEAPR